MGIDFQMSVAQGHIEAAFYLRLVAGSCRIWPLIHIIGERESYALSPYTWRP
jgi:hypothetical protein